MKLKEKGPKLKKTLEKGGVLEIIWKLNLGSRSLKMTQLRHFRFLYLKKKTLLIHMFIYVIFLFLVRERRKKGITGFWWWEKKLSFTSIPATKMSLLVSTSSSVMVIVWSFNVAWKIRLKSRKPKLTQFDFK
jgi:ABC-type sulfate transport system permease component